MVPVETLNLETFLLRMAVVVVLVLVIHTRQLTEAAVAERRGTHKALAVAEAVLAEVVLQFNLVFLQQLILLQLMPTLQDRPALWEIRAVVVELLIFGLLVAMVVWDYLDMVEAVVVELGRILTAMFPAMVPRVVALVVMVALAT
jgi:hypothetical protein